MGLVGDSSELSLPDLISAKGLSRGVCRVLVLGRHGAGSLYLADGAVVHAEYDRLAGEAAAHAILSEGAVSYRVTSDVALPAPNMHVDHRHLLMEAAVRSDELRRRAPSAPAPSPGTASSGRRPAVTPPARAPARGRRASSAVAGGLVLAGLVALAASGTVTFRRSEASATVDSPPPTPPGAGAPAAKVEVVESSSLTGPGDEVPVLVAGEPPRRPGPDVGLLPTIVLRLLVDENGAVARADVYQHRADLSAFEQAALGAARRFVFRPARREGAPVAAWINWPVDFI